MVDFPRSRPLALAARQPVELGGHEGAAAPTGRQRLAQPGPVGVAARESVIEVDALGCYTEASETVTSRCEGPSIGGHLSEPILRAEILMGVSHEPPSPDSSPDGPDGTSHQAWGRCSRSEAVVSGVVRLAGRPTADGEHQLLASMR